MKNNWLTIPDAPQYEINSDLVVRNKLTGKTLTPRRLKRKNGVTLTYSLHGYGVYLTSETAELAKDIPWRTRSLTALANRQAKLDSEVGLTC